MNNYDNLLNEKLNELLVDVYYPGNKILLGDFNKQVLHALKYHTEETLSCTIDEYMSIYKKCSLEYEHTDDNDFLFEGNEVFTMVEMAVCLAAVRSLNPKNSIVGKCDNFLVGVWALKRKNYAAMLQEWNVIAHSYILKAQEYVDNIAKEDMRKQKSKQKLFVPGR